MFPKTLGTVSTHKGGESMPITTNSGGVLHNLSPIYVRNGAILNELSTIYARNGGVLSTIYEKDSGGGGGGDSGGGEVTPPVDPTRTETFHWGNYTGTANTTPHCIGSFTIDESMNCTANLTTFHNMKELCPTPTEMNLAGDSGINRIWDCYYYIFHIYVKKTMDVNGYNSITWENKPDTQYSWYVEYLLNNTTMIFEYVGMSSKAQSGKSGTLPSKPLEKGTYYVYFSNYIGLYTEYNRYMSSPTKRNLIKYMPWDNMSVDVTLTLKPIS